MPFDFSAGAQGAGSFSAAGPIGMAVGGLLGGFLGGQPRLPRELRDLYRFQYSLADQMRRFSQSVPLSDPGEQAALAQQRGLLGQEQLGQRQNLLGEFNLASDRGNVGDFLTNLSQQQVGQRQALDAQHLLAALSARRQGMVQASQIAGGATNAVKDYQQPPDFAGLFGNIARLYSLNQGMRGPGPGSSGVYGRTMWDRPGQPATPPGMDPAVAAQLEYMRRFKSEPGGS